MPKLKNYGSGKRVCLWVPERLLPKFLEIENKSKFFQWALDQRGGVMEWAIRKEREGYGPEEELPEVLVAFNLLFPVNELTKKRQDARTERENPSPSPQPNTELW